jgi:hypothetical protein
VPSPLAQSTQRQISVNGAAKQAAALHHPRVASSRATPTPLSRGAVLSGGGGGRSSARKSGGGGRGREAGSRAGISHRDSRGAAERLGSRVRQARCPRSVFFLPPAGGTVEATFLCPWALNRQVSSLGPWGGWASLEGTHSHSSPPLLQGSISHEGVHLAPPNPVRCTLRNCRAPPVN